MARNSRCIHLPPNLRRGHVSPSINLLIAGSKEGITVCPDCYESLKQGGSIKVVIATKNKGHRYKVYDVVKAWESTDDVFIEVRTQAVKDEDTLQQFIQNNLVTIG